AGCGLPACIRLARTVTIEETPKEARIVNCSKGLSALILLATSSAYLGAEQPDASNRFYQAVRNNDLASLRSLIKSADVNSKDERGSTPLMFAAAFGSVDGMKLLLDA